MFIFSIKMKIHFFYIVPKAQEVFKNLPGARGVIFPKYEPVAIHLDPIHPQNYQNIRPKYVPAEGRPTLLVPNILIRSSQLYNLENSRPIQSCSQGLGI